MRRLYRMTGELFDKHHTRAARDEVSIVFWSMLQTRYLCASAEVYSARGSPASTTCSAQQQLSHASPCRSKLRAVIGTSAGDGAVLSCFFEGQLRKGGSPNKSSVILILRFVRSKLHYIIKGENNPPEATPLPALHQ